MDKVLSKFLYLRLKRLWRRCAQLLHDLKTSPEVPCHYERLFINADGSVYPCCHTRKPGFRRSGLMRIGHAADPDLAAKLRDWDPPACACNNARLRRGRPGDRERVGFLIAELSLACNAGCLMCCANSPGWQGSYDGYADLDKLLANLKPEIFSVLGGEVSAQPESLAWLERVKSTYPELRLNLTTNGQVDPRDYGRLAALFDYFAITYTGQQPETYRAVARLPDGRSRAFAAAMIAAGKKVSLKFLVTPVSLHELASFLTWAVALKPHGVQVGSMKLHEYHRRTPDRFWEKYVSASVARFHSELRSLAPVMLRDDIALVLSEDLWGTAALCGELGLRQKYELGGPHPF